MKKYKISKLGKQEGCMFDDIIVFKLNPSETDRIGNILISKALEDDDYNSQGIKRELADVFIDAYWEWKSQRKNL